MLALIFAKLCRKFVIAHPVLSVPDLLIACRPETPGQPGPWEFQISNLAFFLFKIHGLYSLGVLQLQKGRLQLGNPKGSTPELAGTALLGFSAFRALKQSRKNH